jgi:hypothetical protein
MLSDGPDKSQSLISCFVFQEFVSALERHVVEITGMKIVELFRLCEDFTWEELRAKLSQFE